MYTRCKNTDGIIYGDRVPIRPFTTPLSSKVIQWSILLPPFGEKAATLVEPFNFEPISLSNRVKQKVHHDQWNQLVEVNKLEANFPPTMGTKK